MHSLADKTAINAEARRDRFPAFCLATPFCLAVQSQIQWRASLCGFSLPPPPRGTWVAGLV